jgi:hypothetical protein
MQRIKPKENIPVRDCHMVARLNVSIEKKNERIFVDNSETLAFFLQIIISMRTIITEYHRLIAIKNRGLHGFFLFSICS